MSPHFVITAVGTQGDLRPLLALARELLNRGFAVDVLGNEWAAARSAAQSIPFTTIAPTFACNWGTIEDMFGTYVFPSFEPTFRFFESLKARRENVVVLNWTNCTASTLLCERYHLPLCRLVLAPYFLPSLIDPPEPWARRMKGPLGRAFAQYTLPQLYAQFHSHPFILQHLNAQRAALGLGAVDRTSSMNVLVKRYIGLFPDWFCRPPADWPQALDLAGFPLPTAEGELPPGILDFVRQHGPPVVFTPGTGAPHLEQFFERARQCCERLGVPGILLGGSSVDPAGERCGSVLHLREVELALLLPRARLLVHHGGMGTTARALEAGVPQIVIPYAYDQPDNGARVEALGAGKLLMENQVSVDTLVSVAGQLLSSEDVKRCTSACAERMRGSRGVERAVDALLEHFAGLGSGSRRSVG
jgi:rhamnosyltransferase subunit B